MICMSKNDTSSKAVLDAPKGDGADEEQGLTATFTGSYCEDVDNEIVNIVALLDDGQEALTIELDNETGEAQCRILDGSPLCGT
jgi:hypothetical protein